MATCSPLPQTLHRQIVALLALAFLLIGSVSARAESALFHSNAGAAINGYDTVAYFIQGAPVPGDPKHAVMWKGVVWRFSSAQNRETFEANPRAYAPQFGGYCAFAMSQGYLSSTDPLAWRIYKGKLYLIHNHQTRIIWLKNIDFHLAQASAHWPHLLSE